MTLIHHFSCIFFLIYPEIMKLVSLENILNKLSMKKIFTQNRGHTRKLWLKNFAVSVAKPGLHNGNRKKQSWVLAWASHEARPVLSGKKKPGWVIILLNSFSKPTCIILLSTVKGGLPTGVKHTKSWEKYFKKHTENWGGHN